MKKFGLGKKSDSDDSSRSGLFGRKKASAVDKNDNPYAQSQDPYAAPAQPAMTSRPSAGYGSTPPPPYATPQQNGSQYGNEKIGAAGGYGANRFDSGGQQPYGGTSQSSRYNRGPQGYGGFGSNNADDPDQNRDQLLAGARPKYVGVQSQAPPLGSGAGYGQSGAGRGAGGSSYDGYGEPRELTEEEKQDEEVADTKRQIRQARDESLRSTERSLAMLNQVEEQGMATYMMLGEQGQRGDNIIRNLNLAAANARVGEKAIVDLERANRSFLNPTGYIGSKEKAQRALIEQRDQEAFLADKEKARKDAYRHKARFENDMDTVSKTGRGASGQTAESRAANRSKYMFEESGDEDAMEQEERINDNIELMSQGLSRVRRIAEAQKEELDNQKATWEQADEKVGEKLIILTSWDSMLTRVAE